MISSMLMLVLGAGGCRSEAIPSYLKHDWLGHENVSKVDFGLAKSGARLSGESDLTRQTCIP